MLLDVNILIYAFREDAAEHAPIAAFMNELVNSGDMFGVPETCMTSLVRTVTQKAFKPPSTLASVFHFCDVLRSVPTFLQVQPSDRHWKIFQEICVKSKATGALVADAYLAAFAIDRGDEWVTTDKDFSKFPGLTWRHPLKRHAITNPR
jgi:hypothetical protein